VLGLVLQIAFRYLVNVLECEYKDSDNQSDGSKSCYSVACSLRGRLRHPKWLPIALWAKYRPTLGIVVSRVA